MLLLMFGSLLGQAQNIEVVVQMKAHYDRQQLSRQADFFPTKAARRDYVVNELKSFTEASQYDLRVELNELEQQGLVSSVHSLWSANAIYFTTTEEVVQSLAKRPDIESITPVRQYLWIPETETSNETHPSAWIAPNLTQVNAHQVWGQGYMGQGVVIAVIDSGVNYNHDDLADHLWDGGEEFPHHGFDIVNYDDDPMDDLGHGTHCAGTVCGDGTAGNLTGVAPEATLMCVKTIDENGFGGAVNISKGMEWAVEHGCDAISMSLGMANAEVADKELLRHTCEAVLDAGVIALVCTGNEGHLQYLFPIPNNVRVPASCPPPYLDPDQMVNPGGLSCVLAVGAVDYSDTAAYFTSQGPVTWLDTEFGDYPHNAFNNSIGLIRPDVCAPGVDIVSLKYNSNHGYTDMSGTSQATPCVAGVVALMLCKNPQLTPAQICQILEETSLKLTPTKSNIIGAGRVDALAAVNAVHEWNAVPDQQEDLVHVFPNPSQDAFTVQCEGMKQVDVFSMDGRLVRHIGTNGSQCLIDGLGSGVYFVRVSLNDRLITSRIVRY